MKIIRIRLQHFRQFYGEQSLELAQPGKKNITLVHAENGVGKTTLLNAILWTLFSDTTKKFEQRDKIINFTAEAEGIRNACVEITFEHEGKQYLASRTHAVTPGGYAKPRFEVMKFDGRSGAMGPSLPNPDAFINTVVPRAMAPYFFFDGEQAETFSSEMNHKKVAEAIRNILGCTILATAAEDLDYVARSFSKELGAMPGEEEIQNLEQQISVLQEQIDVRKKQIQQAENDIEAQSLQLAEINEKLQGAQEAAQFQKQREAKEHELTQMQQRIAEAETEILRWIETKGIAMVSTTLIEKSLELIEKQSLRGRIPSPYNEEFVKELLQNEKCICERPLQPASHEWNAVQTLLKDAANAEQMGRVMRARSRIQVFKEVRGDAIRSLEMEEKRLADAREQQRELERVIEELGKKLESLPIAEIQERERARKELDKKREATKATRIRLQVQNEHDEKDRARRESEVDRLAVHNQQGRKLLVRRDLAQSGSVRLQEVLKSYEEKARQEIQEEVNRILDHTAHRHYRLEIDPSFELKLLFANGTSAPKSSGENQLMSLAFISALVKFAERRAQEEHDELLIPATVAPLVLDSPFGQLDDNYRADTAGFVPKMAPQVVLLVSSSQGKEEVLAALGEKVGKEYALIIENQGPKGNKKQDFLTARGKRIATTLFNRERNMTRIEKVG